MGSIRKILDWRFWMFPLTRDWQAFEIIQNLKSKIGLPWHYDTAIALLSTASNRRNDAHFVSILQGCFSAIQKADIFAIDVEV